MSFRPSSTAALVFALTAAASSPLHATGDTGEDCDVSVDADVADDTSDSDVADDTATDADVVDDIVADADVVDDTATDARPDSTDTAADADEDTAADASGDVAADAADDTAADTGETDIGADAEPDAEEEPAIYTLTLNVSAFARGDSTATVAVTLEGPESLEFVVDAPGSMDIEVKAGTYAVSLVADGFDPVATSVAVLSDSELSSSLYPSTPVQFSGQVMLGPNQLPGADIVITGSRSSAPIVAESGDQGLFTIEGIPAGFYDIEVSYGGGWMAERDSVDLLGDTEMAFVLPVLDEERTIETTQSACSAAPASGVSWFAALGLVAWMRRR